MFLYAANTKYPAYLDSLGLTTSAPKVYAKGKLGLWTLKEFTPTINLLTTDTIQKYSNRQPKDRSLWKSEHRCIET